MNSATTTTSTTTSRRNLYDDDHDDNMARRQTRPAVKLERRSTHVASADLPVDYSSLLCGLVAGVTQAGVFNPYDRALYLSVKENRPFFHARNWHRPYTGFLQSLSGRAAAGGLYFPLEHFFLQQQFEGGQQHSFLAGTAAGAVNATVLNPLSAIKYKTWGRTESRGMVQEAASMLRKSSGSLRPFWNGLPPTLYRDVVFGGCYTWLRLRIITLYTTTSYDDEQQIEEQQQQQHQWMGNFLAAALATLASGPFNYARNIQYATSSRERADGTWRVLLALVDETREQDVGRRWRFVQSRLRIGWGTLRVAAGMAFAQAVYDFTSEQLTTSKLRR